MVFFFLPSPLVAAFTLGTFLAEQATTPWRWGRRAADAIRAAAAGAGRRGGGDCIPDVALVLLQQLLPWLLPRLFRCLTIGFVLGVAPRLLGSPPRSRHSPAVFLGAMLDDLEPWTGIMQ